MLDGEFIHTRCCAHILNLIVSDALKFLHVYIIWSINVVKYVRSSPAWLQIFKDFAKENKLLTKKLSYQILHDYCSLLSPNSTMHFVSLLSKRLPLSWNDDLSTSIIVLHQKVSQICLEI